MTTITDQAATFRQVTDPAAEKPTHTHVVLDDGTEFVVRTGQAKDLIAWDRLMSRKYDRATQHFIFAGFLAYQGAHREGFYTGTIDAFLDVLDDLTPVRLAGEDPEPAGEPVPPTTRTAPPA
jgi:hypothetical protein